MAVGWSSEVLRGGKASLSSSINQLRDLITDGVTTENVKSLVEEWASNKTVDPKAALAYCLRALNKRDNALNKALAPAREAGGERLLELFLGVVCDGIQICVYNIC